MKLVAAILVSLLVAGAAKAAEPPAGALACSGCHPASGGDGGPPRLIGMKAQDIADAMQAFRSGARAATVMDRIAKGFTEPEAAAIAQWFATQSN